MIRCGTVTGEGNEIDRAAEGQPAILESIRPAIDFRVIQGAHVEIFNDRLAVALIETDAIQQEFHAQRFVRQVNARTAHGNLGYFHSIFALHEQAGHALKQILKIGRAALVHFVRRLDREAARNLFVLSGGGFRGRRSERIGHRMADHCNFWKNRWCVGRLTVQRRGFKTEMQCK